MRERTIHYFAFGGRRRHETRRPRCAGCEGRGGSAGGVAGEGGGRIAIGDRTPHAALAAKHASRTQGGKVHVHFACCRVPCMVPCRAATIEDIVIEETFFFFRLTGPYLPNVAGDHRAAATELPLARCARGGALVCTRCFTHRSQPN
jgi:hypothetical protein